MFLDIATKFAIIIDMTNELGRKIRELRAERGWTQNELAKRSGVDRTTIASIETGKVANPSAETFIKLARAFSVRLEELHHIAGYIDSNVLLRVHKETLEEILDRFRIVMPSTVPIYADFPFHAGKPVEPMDYIPVVKDRAKGRNLEGYITHGKCLEPEVKDGDIIIIDREGEIEQGDIIACLVNDEIHLARLRKIADEIWIENNHGRIKLEECQVAAPVIEVRRRLK